MGRRHLRILAAAFALWSALVVLPLLSCGLYIRFVLCAIPSNATTRVKAERCPGVAARMHAAMFEPKNRFYFGDPISNGVDALLIANRLSGANLTTFDDGKVITQVR
jgi:hypothetical protein